MRQETYIELFTVETKHAKFFQGRGGCVYNIGAYFCPIWPLHGCLWIAPIVTK